MNPKTPTPHHVRHHDIRKQPVTYNSYLTSIGHTRLWRSTEIRKNLRSTSRLLSGVSENGYACVLFQEFRTCVSNIIICTSGVADDQEL